ncbi:hypothetical protein KKB40_06060, partial [Patescibacteria group bacterium]|nr:hypothetical protein [Patescibacteria group bacterium]
MVFSYLFEGSFAKATVEFFTTTGNFQTLLLISQKLGNLVNLVRLSHYSFYNEGVYWAKYYNFFLITLLEFVVFGIIFSTIVKFRKKAVVLFLAILLTVSLFLAKGNNPPLGELYEFLFLHFSFLQIFRNPFEKMLFISSVAAGPIFALGVSTLAKKVETKRSDLIYTCVLSWLLLGWGFPFWTGLVFSNRETLTEGLNIGYEIEVPDHYKEASSWLESQEGDFRIIAFPLGEEGITYLWEKGYSGVELSNQLLPVSLLSFNTTIPYLNTVAGDLEKSFLAGGNFTRIMDRLNARYLMFRSDIDWRGRGMRDPRTVTKVLEKMEEEGYIKKVAVFGELSFWEKSDWEEATVFATDRIILGYPYLQVSDLTRYDSEYAILTPSGDYDFADDKVAGIINHPVVKYTLGYKRNPVFERRQDIFPTVRFSPSSPFYRLILVKERLESSLVKDGTLRFTNNISILGKRLVEAKEEVGKGNSREVVVAIEGYQKLLRKTTDLLQTISQDLLRGEETYMQEDLFVIFSTHLFVLDEVKSNLAEDSSAHKAISQLEEKIKEMVVENEIAPKYRFAESEEFSVDKRIVYKFDVEIPGQYEIIWGNKSLAKYYNEIDKEEAFQINEEIDLQTPVIDEKGEYIIFDRLDLVSGIYEIGRNTPSEINLIKAPEEVALCVDHGQEDVVFPIENFDPYSSYILSFEYWIKKGSGVQATIETNNASYDDKGEIVPAFFKIIGPDLQNYVFDEKRFSKMFGVSGGADSAELRFTVKPWNICENIFYTQGRERCKDENFRKPYDRTTEVVLKDISVKRILTDKPLMVMDKKTTLGSPPVLEYKKINNSEYLITVNDARQPFYLVFSELFDSGWRVFSSEGVIVGESHSPANIYANSWLIDEKGSYDLILKYAPQELSSFGEKVSLVAFVFGFIISGWAIKKNRNVKVN